MNIVIQISLQTHTHTHVDTISEMNFSFVFFNYFYSFINLFVTSIQVFELRGTARLLFTTEERLCHIFFLQILL